MRRRTRCILKEKEEENEKETTHLHEFQMFGQGKFVFDVKCEIHGKYTLPSREEAMHADLEQETALMSIERALEGGGEGAEVDINDFVMPPSPPPLAGEYNYTFKIIVHSRHHFSFIFSFVCRVRYRVKTPKNKSNIGKDAKYNSKSRMSFESALGGRGEEAEVDINNFVMPPLHPPVSGEYSYTFKLIVHSRRIFHS